MVRIIFDDSEHEAEHRAKQLRDPAEVEELHDYLTHKKNWLDTCDFCLRRAEQELVIQSLQSQFVTCDGEGVNCSLMAALLPEILVNIFLFSMKDDPPRVRETWNVPYTRMLQTSYLGWIQVTHVCRRWRDVAISAAVLWTDLCQGAVLGPSWTEIFIFRAKSAAVIIRHFDEYPKSSEMLCDYILDHPAHLRHVTLSAGFTPFSVLDEYTYTWSSMLVSADLDSSIGCYISPPLFGGYAPNLRHLKLSNIQPWKCHSLLGGLLELDVFLSSSFPPDIDSGDPDPILVGILPPISQALDVLDEAPMLQRLALHYAFPSDDLPVMDRRRTYLNHIQDLSLSAKIVDCISFFGRVIIPHNATLNLTCIPGLYSEKFRDLFCIFIDRLAPIGSVPSMISRLEIGTGRTGDICLLQVYTASQGAATQRAGKLSTDVTPRRCASISKPFITLSLAYATSPQHAYVLRKFFATMPLYDLSYLAIYGCWHIGPDSWRTIIRDSYAYLQSVRLLVLSRDSAQYFFHAIHDDETSTSDLPPSAFPNLDALILRNINFSTFSCALDKVSFQDQMIYDLHDRERRGKKLRALYFISCQGLDEPWVTDLREVVRFVVFGF